MGKSESKKVIDTYLKNGDISLNELVNKFNEVEALAMYTHNNFSEHDKYICRDKEDTFIEGKYTYVPLYQIGTNYIIGWVKVTKIINKTIKALSIITTIKYLRIIKHDYLNFVNILNNIELIDDSELKESLNSFKDNMIILKKNTKIF
jgi:hypothetical protein